jgi:hypothetical protein
MRVNSGRISPSRLYSAALSSIADGTLNPEINRNTGTAQLGGGVDIRTPDLDFFPIYVYRTGGLLPR